jgi:hypothetical protein
MIISRRCHSATAAAAAPPLIIANNHQNKLTSTLLYVCGREERRSVSRKFNYLRVTMDAVGAPAARLHLIGIEAPELELLLEQRSADIRWVMKLAGPLISIFNSIT